MAKSASPGKTIDVPVSGNSDGKSLGQQLRTLADSLMDLLSETPEDQKGPVYARIDDVHDRLQILVDAAIKQATTQYKEALKSLEAATKATEDARKKLKSLADALKVVDLGLKLVLKVV